MWAPRFRLPRTPFVQACTGFPIMQQSGWEARKEAAMAEAALSATERAIENQKIGGLQMRVAALCTLIQICDGYDINSVAWAVPSLTQGCSPSVPSLAAKKSFEPTAVRWLGNE